MSNIVIYSPSTLFSELVESSNTLEKLHDAVKQTVLMGNQSKILHCCICYRFNEELKRTYKKRSDEYKNEKDTFMSFSLINKRLYKKYVAIGKTVIDMVIEENDPSLLNKPMSFFDTEEPKLSLSVKPVKPKPLMVPKVEYDELVIKITEYESKANILDQCKQALKDKDFDTLKKLLT